MNFFGGEREAPAPRHEAVNGFCRKQMREQGAEAPFFLGPTLPAVAGLPRRAAWPEPLPGPGP